jgi:hypothetical protein
MQGRRGEDRALLAIHTKVDGSGTKTLRVIVPPSSEMFSVMPKEVPNASNSIKGRFSRFVQGRDSHIVDGQD